MITPVVPAKDVPYTLSLAATISSQHGIKSVQCNCPANPIEYLEDKTSAQVRSERALCLPAPLFLGPDLPPHSIS